MLRLDVTKARADLAATMNRVAYRGERIVIQKHGKDLCALVPIEDVELTERLENRIDLDRTRKALAEPGTVSLAAVKKALGF